VKEMKKLQFAASILTLVLSMFIPAASAYADVAVAPAAAIGIFTILVIGIIIAILVAASIIIIKEIRKKK
jgi:hypothetical protein